MQKAKLIQDWTDYNKSLIYTLSDDYFKQKGIDAYHSQTKNIIPNAITNSYPHARSFAAMIEANLAHYPETEKIKVLECGAGSGIFARSFLLAAKEMGFLDRIEYLITDISAKALEQIKEKNILVGFEENINYKLLELDLLDIANCKDLNGEEYQVKDISATVLNYVYDAMPMIVLRDNNGRVEKLQLRFSEPEANTADIVNNVNYLKNLIKEERWLEYNTELSAEEEQYMHILKQSIEKNPNTTIYYSYGALAITEKILEISNENAMIYACEMPDNPDADGSYEVYGNTTAHVVNDDQITMFTESLDVNCIKLTDDLLIRMLIFKNKKSQDMLLKIFQEEFLLKNNTSVHMDLRQAIDKINSAHSLDILKVLVEKFLSIDGYSAIAHIAIAKLYELAGNLDKAITEYQKAELLDFMQEFKLRKKIETLKANMPTVIS